MARMTAFGSTARSRSDDGEAGSGKLKELDGGAVGSYDLAHVKEVMNVRISTI